MFLLLKFEFEVETNTLSDSLAFIGFQPIANDSARSCAGDEFV